MGQEEPPHAPNQSTGAEDLLPACKEMSAIDVGKFLQSAIAKQKNVLSALGVQLEKKLNLKGIGSYTRVRLQHGYLWMPAIEQLALFLLGEKK